MVGVKDYTHPVIQQQIRTTTVYYVSTCQSWLSKTFIPGLIVLMIAVIVKRIALETRTYKDLVMAAGLAIIVPYFAIIVTTAQQRVVESGLEDPMLMVDDLSIIGRGHLMIAAALVCFLLLQFNEVTEDILEDLEKEAKQVETSKKKR
ncbi:hypothetical protein SARC_04827 [Sphaeroforma arctica JP610]|uniref:Uncharacterized protein n=1 Tax=Sphaeroforma arctica JP610 TaxID=667725 RepID=A0A0L0G219_9EUKA|nr:hypothetical protein SARC_04827 [Sphaeroforma arctica JP610]KNC82884.1 hypothetical protein SARC_04827 [Sphaeroforma arctica JP610]|eukprot:XP_014156786.1 hypothetical protein SARC_04827 [Sphaeroforma arctica JP610]